MQDWAVTLIKIAKMQDWIVTNVTDIFSATLPESELHFAFLIFKGAKCAFEPPDERGVHNAPDVSRIVVLGGGITNFPAIFIHHK